MKIGIFGVGKVGGAFLEACSATTDLKVVCLKAGRNVRSQNRIRQTLGTVFCETGAEVLQQVDVMLLTVPDGRIAKVAAEIATELEGCSAQSLAEKVCLHCSGSLGLEPLKPLSQLGIHCGSLHPLQSFAAAKPAFTSIGMAVDGDTIARQSAIKLAEGLRARPFYVPAEERQAYHAAACFCSNYLVTVTAIAQQLLARWTPDQATALQVLLPLIDGTVNNLHQTEQAQAVLTGPIARGDIETVAGHLEILPKNLQKVYRELALQTVELALANGSIDRQTAEKIRKILLHRQ